MVGGRVRVSIEAEGRGPRSKRSCVHVRGEEILSLEEGSGVGHGGSKTARGKCVAPCQNLRTTVERPGLRGVPEIEETQVPSHVQRRDGRAGGRDQGGGQEGGLDSRELQLRQAWRGRCRSNKDGTLHVLEGGGFEGCIRCRSRRVSM